MYLSYSNCHFSVEILPIKVPNLRFLWRVKYLNFSSIKVKVSLQIDACNMILKQNIVNDLSMHLFFYFLFSFFSFYVFIYFYLVYASLSIDSNCSNINKYNSLQRLRFLPEITELLNNIKLT